jgi:hypothetical protein
MRWVRITRHNHPLWVMCQDESLCYPLREMHGNQPNTRMAKDAGEQESQSAWGKWLVVCTLVSRIDAGLSPYSARTG